MSLSDSEDIYSLQKEDGSCCPASCYWQVIPVQPVWGPRQPEAGKPWIPRGSVREAQCLGRGAAPDCAGTVGVRGNLGTRPCRPLGPRRGEEKPCILDFVLRGSGVGSVPSIFKKHPSDLFPHVAGVENYYLSKSVNLWAPIPKRTENFNSLKIQGSPPNL